MFESKEAKFIREDQRTHPNCHYSQSYQSMCSNRTGKYQCEKITKIIRQCPGESPREVYRDANTDNNSNDQSVDGSGIENHLGNFLNGFFNFGGGGSSSRGPPGFGDSPSIDSLLNDFLQMSPPLDHRIDQYQDRQKPRDSDRPMLLPPHKVPKGQPPIKSPAFKSDEYVNGPPETI